MSHLLRNLLIALAITVLLGVVYAMFFKGGDDEEEVVETRTKTDVVLDKEKILADINKIESYNIDNAIFDDVRFMSLTDYHVEIEDVGTGRPDPFQPVD